MVFVIVGLSSNNGEISLLYGDDVSFVFLSAIRFWCVELSNQGPVVVITIITLLECYDSF